MGGAIVTLISERYPMLFTGTIAVGAALLIRNDPINNPIQFLYKCQIPSLYLSNYTEVISKKAAFMNIDDVSPQTSCIYNYKEQCVKNKAPVEPVLYQIGRPGHGTLNITEYMNAFDTLLSWIETKKRPEDEECYMLEVKPERTAIIDEHGANFSVSRIDRLYGDIDLNLHAQGELHLLKIWIFKISN